jgi:glycosyltransferase involved in cell wall biosynthesis
MLTSSVSRRGGGLLPAVAGLSRALKAVGTHVSVFSASDSDSDRDREHWTNIPIKLHKVRGPKAYSFQSGLLRALRNVDTDIIHLHGLWTYLSFALLRVSKISPTIVSPHGMLDSWALKNSGLKKKVVAALYERRTLAKAACIHALCTAERDAIRAYGFTGPIAIIPNGIDPAPSKAVLSEPNWKVRIPAGEKILLFLGRIHPKKGLSNLLHALSQIEVDGSEIWHLVVAGWDQNGTQELLSAQAHRIGLGDRVHFVGPQYGLGKDATLAAADAFVLPSLSEGLPIAILEAWAFSLPVLMTESCNLDVGFQKHAAIKLPEDPEKMANGLRLLFSLTEAERKVMGANGLSLAQNDYSWENVAHKMQRTYQWILGTSEKPDFVETGD